MGLQKDVLIMKFIEKISLSVRYDNISNNKDRYVNHYDVTGPD